MFGEQKVPAIFKEEMKMKKRLSKKILAIFLAALMVATSIPLSVLHVFAADAWTDAAEDAEVINIENKMSEFEDKLYEKDVVYCNVEPAYAAYVACREALDAYIYGGETDALTGKCDALDSAIKAMTKFTGKVTISNTYDTVYSSEDAGGAAYLSKVLWSETGVSDARGKAKSGDGVEALTLYYPTVTLLYDGTDVKPVTKILVNASGESGNKNRYVYAIKSISNDFTFNSNWKGTADSFSTNWNNLWKSGSATLSNTNTSGSTYYQTNKKGTIKGSYKPNGFANQLVYTGSLASDSTNSPVYSTTVYPSLFGYFGGEAKFDPKDSDNANVKEVKGTAPIYIVNYAVIKNAVKVDGKKIETVQFTDYSQGGLKTYFTAMDSLTSFNPNDYFTSSNNYSGYATEAKNRVTAANNASFTDTDKAGYAAIRTAMSADVRKKYANAIENNGAEYMDDSWKHFKAVYKKCQELMAKVNDSGSNYATGKPYSTSEEELEQWAQSLTEAVLVDKVKKADTTQLVNLINDFEAYDSGDFTKTSYDTFVGVVKEIKEAVWKSEANWGDSSFAPKDDEAGNKLVADNEARFKEEIKKLRLSPDAMATTANGRTTLKQVLELEAKAGNASNYTNYSQFSDALVDANAYLEKLDLIPFTNYEAQMNEYRNYVNEVVDAYRALEYGFIATPNGTSINNSETTGTGSTGVMNSEDHRTQSVQADYSSKGIILRTTHDAVNAKYGHFDVTFGTNVDGKDNNALDSISINATAPKIGDNGAKLHINKEKKSETPTALLEEQKKTYAGCLSYNNFNVNNIKLERYNSNTNISGLFVTDKSGNKTATGTELYNTDLTDVLSTTEGQSVTPIAGGVFLRASSSDSEAKYTLRGDLNYYLGETQKQTLTESTIPTLTSYTLGTNFGAVSVWTVNNMGTYSAYNYYTSAQNSKTLDTTVQVLDVTPLKDLADECNAMLEQKNKYTEASWTTFTDALQAAQNFPGYATMSADAILTTVVGKYTNLFNARKNLVVRDITYTFKYKVNELDTNGDIVKDSTGKNVIKDETRNITLKYGEVFKDNATAFEQFNKEFPTYVSEDGLNTCKVDVATWVSSLGIAFDPEAAVTEDTTFTCSYNQTPNSANWTEYNAAQSELNAKLLKDETYTYDSLEKAVNAVNDSSIKFYYLDADTKNAMMSDRQAEITAETQTLKNIANSLVEVNADLSVAKAVEKVKETQKADDTKKDLDMYRDASQEFEFTRTVSYKAVSTNEVFEVKGLIYSDATALDNAIKNYLNNNLQLRTYNIYLNGKPLTGIYEYGTAVTVYANGTVETGEQAAAPTGSNYAWNYSFSAPSRDNDFGKDGHDNKVNATPERYMLTAPALSFIVNGETYLTTKAVDSTAQGYIVTVKSGLNGNVLNVIQTNSDGSFTLPAAPSIPYYTFVSYGGGFTAGPQKVSENTTITANYTSEEKLTVDIFHTSSPWGISTPTEHNSVDYNTRLSYTYDDAYCWAYATYIASGNVQRTIYRVIHYGSSYTFYVSNTISNDDGQGIVALTKAEYENLVFNQSAYDEITKKAKPSYGDLTDLIANANSVVSDTGTVDDSTLILANVDASDNKTLNPAEPAVTSLETPVYASDKTQMTFIGTFVLPEGYTMVESGFLFSGSGYAVSSTTKPAQAPDLKLENVNNKSIRRLKSTRHTIGNQFVINVAINSESGSCYYRPYTIFKKGDQKITVYGAQFAVNDIQAALSK